MNQQHEPLPNDVGIGLGLVPIKSSGNLLLPAFNHGIVQGWCILLCLRVRVTTTMIEHTPREYKVRL